MKCPVDGIDLVMSDRQGIEIDYCPQCRGVWLDRGEIDKIVERSVTMSAPAQQQQQAPMQQPRYDQQQYRNDNHHRDYDDDDHYRHDNGHGYGQGHHKRKESWFGELFD